jgi:hypothetical protein
MPTLHLIKFKPPIALLPKGTSHWALFLPHECEEGDSEGLLYSVKKESFTSTKTEFQRAKFDPQSASDVLSCIALTEICIKHVFLAAVCYQVSDGRPFHLISRNCQHWVYEVIEKLTMQSNMADVGQKVIKRIKDTK